MNFVRVMAISMVFMAIPAFLTCKKAIAEDDGVIDLNPSHVTTTSSGSTRGQTVNIEGEYEQQLEAIRKEKEEVLKLLSEINRANRSLSESQLGFLTNYFNVYFGSFGAVFAVIGAAAASAYAFTIRGIKATIKTTIDRETEGLIKRGSLSIISRSLGHIGYVLWEQVQKDYHNFLAGKLSPGEQELRHLSYTTNMVADLTERSLQDYERLSRILGTNARSKHHLELDGRLRNLWVYYMTAKYLVAGKTHDTLDIERRERLLQIAMKLRDMAGREPYRQRWFNYRETSDFALLKFGDSQQRQRAKDDLLKLLKNEDGTIPNSWLLFAYDQYFPVSTNGSHRDDIHQLGHIPQRPSTA